MYPIKEINAEEVSSAQCSVEEKRIGAFNSVNAFCAFYAINAINEFYAFYEINEFNALQSRRVVVVVGKAEG